MKEEELKYLEKKWIVRIFLTESVRTYEKLMEDDYPKKQIELNPEQNDALSQIVEGIEKEGEKKGKDI